jgi:hypothetical protein
MPLASSRAASNKAAALRADIRLWTAIVIIAICGLSIAEGFRIARFSLAMMNIESSEKRTDIINAWVATPGLASRALQADLTGAIDPSDLQAANRRRETLSTMLSIKPLSSVDWLLLSGMQLVTDQPMEQVLESLGLSVVTGPNEGHVMVERGIFGVSLWESLPRDLKSRAAVDLGPMINPRTPAEGAQGGKFQAVLATKSEVVRNELRTALVAAGISPKQIEQRLGF